MSKSIIVGADVSKGYADFFAVDSDRKVVVELFQLDDNKAGHAKLSEQFNLLKKTHRPDRIVFAVESSGGLEDNWLRTVKGSAFVEGYRLNPKVIHHEYRVQHRNSISDQISCMTIAHHVAKNLDQYEPDKRMVDPAFVPARNLIRHIVSLEQDCTGHKNSLQQILYQYLPSLLPLLPKGWSKYFLTILAEYGSKQSIQRAAAQGFKKISRVPKGKAQAIHEALRDGIDVKKTPPMVVSIIRSKALQILALKEEIASLEKVLCEMAPVAGKEVELLCSIRGMGPVAATILLCYIEDVHRFDDAKSMAAFFGVQPRIKVSGDGKTKIGMSKQGSALVRYTLYLLAFRTLSGEPYLRSIYAKFRRQGMGHDAALGVLMHKLIRTIFGMLKSGTAFDPGVDQLNQIDSRGKEDSSDPEQPAKEDPKRRFQPRTQDAPLSSRQRRQRKKGQESQAATGAESAGST